MRFYRFSVVSSRMDEVKTTENECTTTLETATNEIEQRLRIEILALPVGNSVIMLSKLISSESESQPSVI